MNAINTEELFIFNKMTFGDKEAFRFFFDKYYTDLCNLVNIYLHDSDTSEEIVQDVFIYFWEKKKEIQVSTSVKFYLVKAAKNKCLNHLRNQKNRTQILSKIQSTQKEKFDLPLVKIDEKLIREAIEVSVNTLPEKCREIYRLNRENELSYKEIADELGISVKTVDNQMGKALKRLRELLKPFYNDFL